MIRITQDEFGYFSAQIYSNDETKYLGTTFRYIDREVCVREAVALQRIYNNDCSAQNIAEREAFIKNGGSID